MAAAIKRQAEADAEAVTTLRTNVDRLGADVQGGIDRILGELRDERQLREQQAQELRGLVMNLTQKVDKNHKLAIKVSIATTRSVQSLTSNNTP